MKKLNKALALGMAGAMSLSLAACGGSTSSSAAATGDTAGTTDEVVTLTWVTVGNGQPANYDAWLAQINPYLEEKIGVNLDVQVVSWGDWDNRRNVIGWVDGHADAMSPGEFKAHCPGMIQYRDENEAISNKWN